MRVLWHCWKNWKYVRRTERDGNDLQTDLGREARMPTSRSERLLPLRQLEAPATGIRDADREKSPVVQVDSDFTRAGPLARLLLSLLKFAEDVFQLISLAGGQRKRYAPIATTATPPRGATSVESIESPADDIEPDDMSSPHGATARHSRRAARRQRTAAARLFAPTRRSRSDSNAANVMPNRSMA